MSVAACVAFATKLTPFAGAGLDPPFRGVYRDAYGEQKLGDLRIKGNSRIFVNIAKANVDVSTSFFPPCLPETNTNCCFHSLQPEGFPDPRNVNVTRASKDIYLSGDGSERCLGTDLATKIMAHVLRAIFGLPNLRRAPGQSGVLKRSVSWS